MRLRVCRCIVRDPPHRRDDALEVARWRFGHGHPETANGDAAGGDRGELTAVVRGRCGPRQGRRNAIRVGGVVQSPDGALYPASASARAWATMSWLLAIVGSVDASTEKTNTSAERMSRASIAMGSATPRWSVGNSLRVRMAFLLTTGSPAASPWIP